MNEIERLENQKKKLSPACWLSSQMRLNLERAYERERIVKLIDDFKGEEYTDLEIWNDLKHELKHLIDGEQR